MKYLALFFLCIFHRLLPAQDVHCILQNSSDSSALAHASVLIEETGEKTITDTDGEFHFLLSPEMQEVHLQIEYIGCNTARIFSPERNKINTVYISCEPILLEPATASYFTARDIVEKAVAAIPVNYAGGNFIIPSFIRQYQKINGHYRNFMEIQCDILFSVPADKSDAVTAAMHVNALRRSDPFFTDIYDENDFADFMGQNPVYRIAGSLLNPKAFKYYSFSFDSITSPDNYVINYICRNYTTENHGVDNYRDVGMYDEGWESGRFIIDRHSFAFIQIERNAWKKTGYGYPHNNNFVLPDLKYTEELVEGHLAIAYANTAGVWHLQSMQHTYTTAFYRTKTYEKTWTITKYFEWYADVPVAAEVDSGKVFSLNPDFSPHQYPYTPDAWQAEFFPVYYIPIDTIAADMGKNTSLQKQFAENGK